MGTETLEPLLRLLAAAAFAGAIGLDRELRAKPAGLRTNIVVGVASAAFAYVSITAFPDMGSDNSRVASQVVSGIGFLGGGAIFAAGGKPHGLTTAAALWGSAAAGLAAGVGSYVVGGGLVAITLLALWPLERLGRDLFAGRRREDAVVHVVVDDLDTAERVRYALRELGVRLNRMQMEPFSDRISLMMDVHATRDLLDLTGERLRTTAGVSFVSEESLPQDRRGA